MDVELGNLSVGAWRDLTSQEVANLKKAVATSDNRTYAERNKGTGGRRKR